jgi:putative transcriptional regulator
MATMMKSILHNKNASTRFQIIVEIASKGPAIEQKDIAVALGITPQAISEYLKHLVSEGLVQVEGRSRYRVTSSGVNWMLSELRDLNNYVNFAEKAVTDITVNAALAENDIDAGQEVGLRMKDGLLTAGNARGAAARGTAFQNGKAGEDVGVTSVKVVSVAIVPSISGGGSAKTNLDALKVFCRGHKHIGAVGIEAYAALRRADIEPRYFYAVQEVAIQAVRYGLEVFIVCISDELPAFIKRLRDSGLEPQVVDLRETKS